MSKTLSKEEILALAKDKGVKISRLNELIGGYRGKLTDWKNGKTTLNETELHIITDYLLGNETEEEQLDTIDREILVLMRKTRDLPANDKKKFLEVIRGSVNAFIREDNK